MEFKIGDVFRDTYYDNKNPAWVHRKVRVVEVGNDGVLAETFVRNTGEIVTGKPRRTAISFKTLNSGFERVIDRP